MLRTRIAVGFAARWKRRLTDGPMVFRFSRIVRGRQRGVHQRMMDVTWRENLPGL